MNIRLLFNFIFIIIIFSALTFTSAQKEICCGSKPDMDGDGINDCTDNCISISNPNQEDCDKDGVGDACEKQVKSVVINEIMYDPLAVADEFGEYVELYNYGKTPVDITGWKIQNALNSNATLIGKAGESLILNCAKGDPANGSPFVVVARTIDPETNGGIEGVVSMFTFDLKNIAGDTVIIKDVNNSVIDEVKYKTNTTDPTWPPCTQGTSLERIDPLISGNLGSNWQCSCLVYGAGDNGTPNQPNSTNCN